MIDTNRSCVVGRNDMIIEDSHGGGQCRTDRLMGQIKGTGVARILNDESCCYSLVHVLSRQLDYASTSTFTTF